MSDIIIDIIDTMREYVQEITPDIAKRVELAIRQQWGGESYYIAVRGAVIERKRQKINDELRAGYSIAQIELKHNIPRCTIYRLINNKGAKHGRTHTG